MPTNEIGIHSAGRAPLAGLLIIFACFQIFSCFQAGSVLATDPHPNADPSMADPGMADSSSSRPGAPVPPPRATHRESASAPLSWSEIKSERFLSRPGRIWHVKVEETRPGTMWADGEERPLRQTRIRITLETDRGLEELGTIQHVSNTEVALIPPGDPRASRPEEALDDPDFPWPNTCGLDLHEVERNIDLNENDRNELVLRRYATIGDPAATGLVLVEEDEEGIVRIVSPLELVGTLRFEEGILTGVRWREGQRDPLLEASYLSLEKCRFLTELDITGETDCESCCRMLVLLARGRDRLFHPTYLKEAQKSLLDRVRRDLEQVAAGDPQSPLTPSEQAALARAASFFYLTGAGTRTRPQLSQILGARGAQFRAQLLLSRLDEYFLQTRPSGSDVPAVPPEVPVDPAAPDSGDGAGAPAPIAAPPDSAHSDSGGSQGSR